MGLLNNLLVRIRGDSAHLDSTLKKSEGSVLSWAKKVGAAIGIAFGVQQIVNFGKEAVLLAAKAEGIKQAFDRIADKDFLANLRKATRNTVTDLALMQSAVRASNFQLPMEQLATLFEFAQKRAQQTGESVDYLVESIVLGIGRKSPLILYNLGISAVRLREKFGDLGVETATVGDVAMVVGDIVAEELKKMGDVADTTATKFGQLSNAWETFKEGVGKFIAESPLFIHALEIVSSLIGVSPKNAGINDPYALWRNLPKDQLLALKQQTEAQIALLEKESFVRPGMAGVQEPNPMLEFYREGLKILEDQLKTVRQIKREAFVPKTINTSKIEIPDIKSTGQMKMEELDAISSIILGANGISPDQIDNQLHKVNMSLYQGFQETKGIMDDARMMLLSSAEDVIFALGEALGSGNVENLGQSLLNAMAGFLQQFGALLVAYGAATLAFEETFENPYAALAAGAALILLAGLIKGAGSNAKSTVSSNMGGGSSYSGSGTYVASSSEKMATIKVEGEIRGDVIYLSNKRYAEKLNKHT
jgi:hypothetical protein